jgi:hypothetical protein
VLVSAVAGLALLGALAATLASAVADPAAREAAAVTFLVTAAGVTFLGIGAAFWGLLVGAAMTLLHRPRPAGRAAALGCEAALVVSVRIRLRHGHPPFGWHGRGIITSASGSRPRHPACARSRVISRQGRGGSGAG